MSHFLKMPIVVSQRHFCQKANDEGKKSFINLKKPGAALIKLFWNKITIYSHFFVFRPFFKHAQYLLHWYDMI